MPAYDLALWHGFNAPLLMSLLGEEHLFRQEAIQQRHTGHRPARHHRKRRRDGHAPCTGR